MADCETVVNHTLKSRLVKKTMSAFVAEYSIQARLELGKTTASEKIYAD